MKIVFLIRSLDVGGAERQLLNLAEGLSRRGHEVSVMTLYDGGSLGKGPFRAGLSIRSLGKRTRWGAIRPIARLVSMLRHERPDVVHGYLTAGNLLAAAARPLLPETAIVWGWRASDMDFRRYGWFVRGTAGLEGRLGSIADRIIVNSEAGARHAARHRVPAHRLFVVPNGIDTDHFRPLPDEGKRIRETWGIDPGEKLVGIVGRVDPMKDHESFLRAAALLSPSHPSLRCVIVGGGSEDAVRSLKALAATCGLGKRLLWAGERHDMPAVYGAIDLLCSSSAWGEGFPNVVAEAMACGARCVVTDVGDSARIVGDTGVVVQPHDPERLARGIEEALARPDGDAESARRRRRIVEEFGVERLVERTEALLREAVEERHR